jgi:hypothetical protein
VGRIAAALAGGALACAALPGTAAAAGPPGPPTPPPPCSFVLSAPALEGPAVVATVTTAGCAPAAAPYLSVACLQPAGGAAMQCAQGRGGDPALVSVPYLPGVGYTATGRGCAGWGQLPPFRHCQSLGPLAAAL